MAVRDVVQAAAGVGGGDKLYVEDVFSTYLYTGNGSTQTITNGIDLAGEGGMVWFKNRQTVDIHALFDSERPLTNYLRTNGSNAEGTATTNLAFNSNGFSFNNNIGFCNTSGQTYASWTFRKAPKFFDVVSGTTGSDTNYRISHNLGSVPGCIIFKRTDAAGTWLIWHRSLSSATDSRLQLGYNSTSAELTRTNTWGTSGPTDTDFGIDTTYVGSGIDFVAFVYAHDAGGFGDDGEQNVISCGSYTGNGSTDGPVINLGWEPQFVLIKSTSITGNWWIVDSMRKMSLADYSNCLQPNSSIAEDMYFSLHPNATGFSPADTSAEINQSGATYIYMAIRRPMKSFDSGADVFAIDYQGTGGVLPGYKAPFPVDMGMWKDRDGGGTQITSRLTADGLLDATNTNAENKPYRSYSFDYQNGWFDSSTPDTTRVGWMFRRAPGFFDVVAYTGGTGTPRVLNHNLGVAPELLITKVRNYTGEDWVVHYNNGSSIIGGYLNNTSAFANSSTAPSTDITSLTSTTYTLNTSNRRVNGGYNYIAYLFASLPGVSKVGSYTGTGATQTINCGFSSGARFVLIKRTDSTGDWYVWDSARGIVAGNDPYLLLNSTAAEVTSTDYIDPAASGFEISSSAPAAINASGGTFIYFSVA